MGETGPQKTPPWTRHLGVGVEFAGAVGGFVLIGWWVDSRWETAPWGILIGMVLGLVGGMYNLVKASLSAFKQYEKKEPTDRDKHQE